MDGVEESIRQHIDTVCKERSFYREKYLELNDKLANALYREQHLLREVHLLKGLVWKNGRLVT